MMGWSEGAIDVRHQVVLSSWSHVLLAVLPGGVPPQGAVITQCYPTMYYAVHETGHRLGFRHANMYRL